jgi:hypothetical protein
MKGNRYTKEFEAKVALEADVRTGFLNEKKRLRFGQDSGQVGFAAHLR